MSIPQQTIEQVRERARIEDIVRNYVPSLKKKGKNYLGLCPFHKEKTPSFTVSPEKQIYYCFGCHAGGNIFSFISKIERLNFPESVRHVAALVGIEISEEGKSRGDEKREYLLRINQYAMNLYHRNLLAAAGKAAHGYALKRGLTEESIKEFKLGYAPDSWNFLTGQLSAKDVSLELASGLGLVALSTKSTPERYYDRFRNRLIFPIINQKNEVIAFGGRVIGDGEPKYLNSPESELFNKGTILYGFNAAREHISELKRAIVVEGYLDVIGCHQHGIRNVVAPMGTALTQQQVELLSRSCTEVVMLFDADSAGIKASLRSLDVTAAKNVTVRVAQLPGGEDPFEFIVKRGMRQFMAVVDSAVSPDDFRIQRVFEETRHFDTVRRLPLFFEVVREAASETAKSLYLRKISDLLNLDERAVRNDYGQFMRGASLVQKAAVSGKVTGEEIDFLARGHRELVLLLLHYPELLEKAAFDFSGDEMSDPVAKNIYGQLMELYGGGSEVSIDRMFNIFPDGKENLFLEESLSRHYDSIDFKAAYAEIYINLKLYQIERKIEHYAGLLGRQDGGGSGEYLTELEVLRREKEKLLKFKQNK